MLDARIIFSLDGTLISNDYPNLIVGDNDTTTIRISFKNEDGTFLDLRDYAIDCVVVRPDGEKSPSLTLALDYQDSTVAKIKIGNWMTEVSGSDIFTFRLRDTRLARELNLKATGIATLVIGNGNQPADATITDAQLKALQDAIADLSANKVSRANEVGVVYATSETRNEDGTVDDIEIPYSVKPKIGIKTVAVRGEDGRLEIEDPINPKDAVNKQTYDKVANALIFNNAGLLYVSPIDPETGNAAVIYNSSLVRGISDVNQETGNIEITVIPQNLECKPKEDK